jgi:hypothetical protein
MRYPDGSFNIQNKTNPALFVAPMSYITSGDDRYNYLTMQPLSDPNNTWIFEKLKGF